MRTVPDKVPAEFEGVASPARCRRAAETSRENGRGWPAASRSPRPPGHRRRSGASCRCPAAAIDSGPAARRCRGTGARRFPGHCCAGLGRRLAAAPARPRPGCAVSGFRLASSRSSSAVAGSTATRSAGPPAPGRHPPTDVFHAWPGRSRTPGPGCAEAANAYSSSASSSASASTRSVSGPTVQPWSSRLALNPAWASSACASAASAGVRASGSRLSCRLPCS